MTVEIVNMQGGAFRGAVTSFSDTFDNNNTNGFGPNWTCAGLNYVAGGGAFSSIGFVGISTQQATWQATAVNRNDIFPFGWMPLPPMSGLAGRSQFSQFQFISSNSIQGTRIYYIGPTVLNGWVNAGGTGGFRQYMAVCVKDDINSFVALNRFDGSTYANIGAPATAPFALNDVIRIEARIAAGGGSVDLIVLVNGVSVITGTDNTASRSIAGSPGMHRFQYTSVAVPGTSTVVCDNYSCGKL